MINRVRIVFRLRKWGLMPIVDKAKFYYFKVKNHQKNAKFKQENPNVALPPDYMMFESFQLNYDKYYFDGQKTAQWVVDKIGKYRSLEQIKMLDWGCGPARLTRHFPDILGSDATVFGTDYNPKTIDWCAKNMKNVEFSLNDVQPPLNYADNQFDALTSISIFTHLSEENHYSWVKELDRICREDAVLFITTHGEIFKTKLTQQEQQQFDANTLVVRANVTEGHRIFAVYHPYLFMKTLFERYFVVLEHYAGQKVAWGIEQDYWILQKKGQ